MYVQKAYAYPKTNINGEVAYLYKTFIPFKQIGSLDNMMEHTTFCDKINFAIPITFIFLALSR